MATITNQKGPSMTQTAATAATPLVKQRVRRSVSLDYKTGLLMWIVSIQWINMALIAMTILVPESARGILGFVQRDFNIPPVILVTLYLIGIGISLRGITARYGLLGVLTGQAAMALIALFYTLNNTITVAQLAGYGGLTVLGAMGIVAVMQYERGATGFQVQRLLIPTVGVILCLYGFGLGERPDAGIAMFIQTQFGSIIYWALILWFTVGGGYAIPNHLSPWRLFVCAVPLFIYAYMAISLLSSDNNVSFTGIIIHLELAFMVGFVIMIQVKEYARTLSPNKAGA